MKKYTIIALGIILIGIITSSVFLWFFLDKNSSRHNIPVNKIEVIQETTKNTPENAKNEPISDVSQQDESISETQGNTFKTEKSEIKIASFIENQAPFISQAPFGVWDKLHDEACEEAVIIIANGFLNDVKEISNEKANKEILALVDWQIEKYGKHKDLKLEEIQNMALEFYKDNLELSEEISEQSFKKVLANGNIIIIPAAGQELGNPFFTPPGPLYHALVVIGYDELTREFITNDPGTKRGAGFHYSYATLLKSIHDFPGKKEKILEGKSRALIVKKK